jgi:hypothetical protein
MLVSSTTNFTRVSHSVIVESRSRSNMSATVLNFNCYSCVMSCAHGSVARGDFKKLVTTAHLRLSAALKIEA